VVAAGWEAAERAGLARVFEGGIGGIGWFVVVFCWYERGGMRGKRGEKKPLMRG
jgi:hypothetical protein